MELAGACWHVPEFANSQSTLLSTLKDLFLHEAVQIMLPKSFSGVEVPPPFGNLNTVVTEIVGPTGMIRAMRRHGTKRHENHLFSMYKWKGKVSIPRLKLSNQMCVAATKVLIPAQTKICFQV